MSNAGWGKAVEAICLTIAHTATVHPGQAVLPGTPGWLKTIILRLLAGERDDRHQMAQEVADLLSR